MSFLRKMFSGRVQTGDARRFLIEAMLGAMEADGEVTETEMATLQSHLEDHELFTGLTGDELNRFVDLAADAIRTAGGGRARMPEIAKGLPSRAQRLTAYSLACEICVADRDLAEAEIDYLDALQHTLGLEEVEAHEVFEASRKKNGMPTLEEKSEKMRTMMPRFVDCMALMAAADGEIHDEERRGILAVLRNIPDMAVLTGEELEEAVDVALERVASGDEESQLTGVAKVIEQPADRYWTAVYMMIVALADGKSDWREVAFLESAKKTFALSDYQMDVAMDTARQFPAVELGGHAPD
jgi:uncharacterized tellurite resistance protein B-like protein